MNYWQGWVYFFVFFACITVTTGYLWKKDPQLLERRMKAGPTAEKRQSQKMIMRLIFLVSIATIVIPSLDYRYSWSHVSTLIVIIGDLFVILGYYIMLIVLKENTFAASTVEIMENQCVISTGPYAIVRHPMYSGALVMVLGTPLALGSWLGLVVLIPFTLIIIWRLLDEEKLLSANLNGYEDYCKKVRYRLIPLIW